MVAERGTNDLRVGGGGFSWETGITSTSMFRYMEVMWLSRDGKLTSGVSCTCMDKEGDGEAPKGP